MNLKKKANTWCSKYIRLRDALSYCKEYGIDTGQFIRPEDIIGRCCTCGTVKSWLRMDAGHFKGRGLGGGSGTYFDERNIHLQCKQCNAFRGGAPKEYLEFMLGKYGQEIVDEIELKHHTPLDSSDLAMLAMAQYYKEKYNELLKL